MLVIGEGEARILCDSFFDSVNPKKLHKEGYRLYQWLQWCSMWKKFHVYYKDENGVLVKEDMTRTREEFEEALNEYVTI